MNYTYILKCKDETLYTGWTNDIEKRLEAHNAGKGAKYTRSRRPVKLVYLEQFETKEEAMRREYAIKHMTRRAKLGLVMNYKETGQYDMKQEKQICFSCQRVRGIKNCFLSFSGVRFPDFSRMQGLQ